MTNALMVTLLVLFFLCSLLMIELGYRYRPVSRLPGGPASSAGIGPVNSTVLSLMGLVLAFSFSNAAARLDASRKTILDEANAIADAWQRIDLAEPGARQGLRELFRNYTDARIRAYEALPELTGYQRHSETAAALLNRIWSLAVEGTSVSVNRTLLLNELDEVSDTFLARKLSLATHLPWSVFLFLFGIALTGSLLIGTILGGPANRQWFYRLIIAAVLTSTIGVIMDMEYTRVGFNQLKEADSMIVDLRKSMR